MRVGFVKHVAKLVKHLFYERAKNRVWLSSCRVNCSLIGSKIGCLKWISRYRWPSCTSCVMVGAKRM